MRNRVKELRLVAASQLHRNPKNWRRHPEPQKRALAALLNEIGFAGAELARELPDGSLELIDGHCRADLAGDEKVPVLILDVDEAEADKILATFDPIGAMAESDGVALAELLRTVQTQDQDLADMLTALLEDTGSFDVDDIDAPGLADGDREPFQQMTFTLHDEQAATIKAAMDKAKAAGPFDGPNENSNGNALARIAEAYCG